MPYKVHLSSKGGIKHQPPAKLDEEGNKITSTKRTKIYGHKWRQLREWVLRRQPLCKECEKHGKVEPATEVDHHVPHRGDMKLFWDRTNLVGMCASCHSKKTAREDGGFGNRR
jgi:5-methylcytosine-specific restriction protein A